ncbi:hypothetical protein ADEAN_000986700 [Angomonas deanei]|uniref:Uncharacterized protein n=1 Tax=Angomonas deanei TaxID=59799 RepID=A0A7G2CV86_9TRYP|nr:hypothetical protein ADEAN_000986700 [Angomonas deanei]
MVLDTVVEEFRSLVRHTMSESHTFALCDLKTENNIVRYEAQLLKPGDHRERSFNLPLEDDSSLRSEDTGLLASHKENRGTSPVGNSWGLVVLCPSSIPKCPTVLSLANTPLGALLQMASAVAGKAEDDWQRVELVGGETPVGNLGNIFVHTSNPALQLVRLWTQRVSTQMDEFADGAALNLFKLYEYCMPLPLPQFSAAGESSQPSSPSYRAHRRVPPEVLAVLGEVPSGIRDQVLGYKESANLMPYSSSSSSASPLSSLLSSVESEEEGDLGGTGKRRKSVASPVSRSRRRSQHPSVVENTSLTLNQPGGGGHHGHHTGRRTPRLLSASEITSATDRHSHADEEDGSDKKPNSPAYTALVLVDPEGQRLHNTIGEGTASQIVFHATTTEPTEQTEDTNVAAPPAEKAAVLETKDSEDKSSSTTSSSYSITVDDLSGAPTQEVNPTDPKEAVSKKDEQSIKEYNTTTTTTTTTTTNTTTNTTNVSTDVGTIQSINLNAIQNRTNENNNNTNTDNNSSAAPVPDGEQSSSSSEDTAQVFQLLKGFIKGENANFDETLNKSDKVSFGDTVKLNFNESKDIPSATKKEEEPKAEANEEATPEDNTPQEAEKKEEDENKVSSPEEDATPTLHSPKETLDATVNVPPSQKIPSNLYNVHYGSVKENSLCSKSESIAALKATAQYNAANTSDTHYGVLTNSTSEVSSPILAANAPPKEASPTDAEPITPLPLTTAPEVTIPIVEEASTPLKKEEREKGADKPLITMVQHLDDGSHQHRLPVRLE